MEPFDTRRSNRLLLRRPKSDDAEAIAEYWSDPEVHRFLQHPPSDDIAETQTFLEHCASVWDSGEAFPWVIVEGSSSRAVGMIEARPSPHGVELGYVLKRSVWGRGYMTEAVAAVVEWALGQPEVHRVWAYVQVGNVGSQRVLEKVGMKREGVLHRWAPHHQGTPTDAVMYAIWRD